MTRVLAYHRQPKCPAKDDIKVVIDAIIAVVCDQHDAEGPDDDGRDDRSCAQGQLGNVPPLAPRSRFWVSRLDLLCNGCRRLEGRICKLRDWVLLSPYWILLVGSRQRPGWFRWPFFDSRWCISHPRLVHGGRICLRHDKRSFSDLNEYTSNYTDYCAKTCGRAFRL